MGEGYHSALTITTAFNENPLIIGWYLPFSSLGTSSVPVHSGVYTQDNPDILYLASAIVDKVELSKLAACLGVPEDILDDNDGKRDQIVKILLHWQSMHQSDSSSIKLLECLQALDIEETLRTYHGQ